MNSTSNSDEINKWKEKYYNLIDIQEKNEQLFQDKQSILSSIINRLAHAAKGYNASLDPHLDRLQKQIKNTTENDQLKSELDIFSDAILHFKDDLLPNSGQGQIDTETVCQKLLLVLEDTEVPANYEAQVNGLKQRLQSELNQEEFKAVLEEWGALLLNIKQHILSEQEEIEDFLSNITQQLTELSEQASGASVASKESVMSRDMLDRLVSSEMKDLQQSSASATKLDPLKQLITTRLESIARQINDHQEKEGQQRQGTYNQLEEMASKIKGMESETRDLKYKLQIAHDTALRDPLTGLPNRLAYEERLATESARWKRYKTPLTMIVWDVDHFKQINDNYGHKAGDKTLVIISGLLDKNCRQTDFVARFGGEEFVMLLPDTDKESGLILAEKVRKIIEKSGFNAGGKAVSITISCGIAELTDTDNFDSLFERADQALYQAKSNGRNQCNVL